MKFDATGDKFTWAPRLSAQFSPDKLASDNKFNIGSRWSVRGLTVKQPVRQSGMVLAQRFYLGSGHPRAAILFGRGYRPPYRRRSISKGKVLSGAVSGLRGQLWSTQYDLFISTPLSKPDKFHSDALNMGFSLQWRY